MATMMMMWLLMEVVVAIAVGVDIVIFTIWEWVGGKYGQVVITHAVCQAVFGVVGTVVPDGTTTLVIVILSGIVDIITNIIPIIIIVGVIIIIIIIIVIHLWGRGWEMKLIPRRTRAKAGNGLLSLGRECVINAMDGVVANVVVIIVDGVVGWNGLGIVVVPEPI